MGIRDGSRREFNGKPYLVGQVAMTVYATSGTTNASGALTLTLPAGLFTGVYSAHAEAVRNSADPTVACFAQIRTLATTQIVIQVFESRTSGVLLGGTTEGLELSTSAVVVYCTVFGV